MESTRSLTGKAHVFDVQALDVLHLVAWPAHALPPPVVALGAMREAVGVVTLRVVGTPLAEEWVWNIETFSVIFFNELELDNKNV